MGYKIVIVDDEQELLENLMYDLKRLIPDWEILTFNIAHEAKMRVMQGDIDLVLTDIAMPDMNGFELYTALMDYDNSLPVIMMTGFGYDPSHSIVNCKKLGLQDVMFKPVNPDKLIRKIIKRIEKSEGL